MKSTLVAAVLIATLPLASELARAPSVAAKPAPAPASDQASAQSTPRLADGKVDLGGKGVWAPI
jgi:hypothetical protein